MVVAVAAAVVVVALPLGWVLVRLLGAGLVVAVARPLDWAFVR